MSDLDVVLHEGAVRAGWQLVETLERMPPEDARALLADHLAAQAAQAKRELPPLTPWEGAPEKALRVYGNTPDQVRFRRVLDVIEPGDRVLDIGAGHGYLTGIILRDAQPSYYCGIDLRDHIVESAKAMMAANGLNGGGTRSGGGTGSVHLEPKDLYTLTPEWVAEHRPDVLTCLEVLEHVPDAGRALATIAAAMPEPAALVFSVPMLGRLEACWGHVSLFDSDRVRQMCERAGLHVQHVEPLYNTWTLVVASRTAEPLPRLARLLARPLAAPPRADVADPAFHPLRLTADTVAPARARDRMRHLDVRADRAGAHADLLAAPARGLARRAGGVLVAQAVRRSPPRLARRVSVARLAGSRWPAGGVSISGLDGLRALRLELTFRNGPLIRAIHVTAYAGDREVTGWSWQGGRKLPSEDARTVVLRPGKPSDGFLPVGNSTEATDRAERADRVEVRVEVLPGARAGFTVRRAACVR